jgi:GT2 family glycosyltransferase
LKTLSVIIVNYNVCHFLEQALLSVRKACLGISAEIFVVDNNSVDGSVAMVEARFPEVILIASKINLGFSGGNNLALKQAVGKYILLLNPDTLVEETTFGKCIDFMDAHPEAGGLGVRMLDGKGQFLPESKRGLPTPAVAFYKVFGLAALFPKSRKFGRYHLGYLSEHQTHEVEILSGAFMWIRAEALKKTGFLDEAFFMYGEDIDLSYRLILAGYKNFYFPETRIIHYKGESTKRTSINYVVVFYKAMAIFAHKHFGARNAGIFEALINLAIYLRAGMALGIRLLQRAILPLTDAALIYVGMFFLKTYWETNHKHVPGFYPPDFMNLIVPGYIVTWLGTVYLLGGYDIPTKPALIARGTIIGTVVISAITNFFDNWRFSKALILLGGAWSTFSLIGLRLMVHFVKYRNFALGERTAKRIAIVGSPNECARVVKLLHQALQSFSVLGYIAPGSVADNRDDYLGTVNQINEIIELYQINELIFCARDISAQEIISLMTSVQTKIPDYKIVPEQSNYVIGSNHKNSTGDYYMVSVELAILTESNRRNKRFFDVAFSLVAVAILPVLMLLTGKPLTTAKKIFAVLSGQMSFVGFTKPDLLNIPFVKKGVFNPASGLSIFPLDSNTLHRLDNLYAREYSLSDDIRVMLRVIKGFFIKK